jgi:hypothetical protein
MGLAAVGHFPVVGSLTAGQIFMASDRVGQGWNRLRQAWPLGKPAASAEPAPFNILKS